MVAISVDIEADGPIPGDYSMISLGAVVVDHRGQFDQTFYGEFRPISEKWVPDALKVSGFTREETMEFPDAGETMEKFDQWLLELINDTKQKVFFFSDNNGFDWRFVNWYAHHFLGQNRFGFSSTNIGSLYKGMEKDMFVNFKHLRKTKHTHNPVDDAKGNAEALLAMKKMGLKIRL